MSATIWWKPVEGKVYLEQERNAPSDLTNALQLAFGSKPIHLTNNDMTMNVLQGMIYAGLLDLQLLYDYLLELADEVVVDWSN